VAKLLEDHAKGVFASHGVSVPGGRSAATAVEAEAVARELGGVVVVKAVVPVGKRAKGGGVRFAASPAEAGAEAAAMLQRSVHGVPVFRMLVERRIEIVQELYASIGFDSLNRAPLLLLSAVGGVDIEELAVEAPHRLVRVFLEEGLNAHRIREGWRRAGLGGAALVGATQATTGLAAVFGAIEARLLEVNPLALTADGRAVAADAVVVLDDAALGRHPDLQNLVQSDADDAGARTALERRVREINEDPSPGVVRVSEFVEGVIGSMVSGGGGGLMCLDLLDSLGVRPLNTFDITPGPIERKMYLTARAILAHPRVRGLIVGSNITNFNRVDVKVRAVVQALEDEGVDPTRFPVVIRLTGPGAEAAREVVRRLPGIEYYEDEVTLEDAIRRIVHLVHGQARA
jgi:succinyl-CoA synthetase beta subunit/citryl-CoA synthetase large subunit